MAKFCPECGSVFEEGVTKCSCGYDIVTGVREVKEEEKQPDVYVDYFYYMNDMPIEDKIKEAKKNIVKLKDLKNKKVDLGEIVSYSYTSSGGMMGSYYNLTLYFNKNEVIKTFQEWHHADRIKSIYSIDDETKNKIKKLIIDNNICAWDKIPINNFYRALDATSTSTSFRFEKDSVFIDGLANIDDEARHVLKEIDSLIVIDDSNKISEEKEIDNGGASFLGMGMNPIVDKDNKPDTDEYNEYLHFCPNCGSKMYKGIDKCNTCNYVIPDELKNNNN